MVEKILERDWERLSNQVNRGSLNWVIDALLVFWPEKRWQISPNSEPPHRRTYKEASQESLKVELNRTILDFLYEVVTIDWENKCQGIALRSPFGSEIHIWPPLEKVKLAYDQIFIKFQNTCLSSILLDHAISFVIEFIDAQNIFLSIFFIVWLHFRSSNLYKSSRPS